MSDPDLKSLCSYFEGLGYERWNKPQTYARNDIWFRSNPNSDGTFHIAYFAYKPRARAYGIRLGVSNEAELFAIEKNIDALCGYTLKPDRKVEAFMIMLWMLYTPAYGKWSSLLSIPDRNARHEWRTQIDLFTSIFLRPVFWGLHDAEAALEFLLKDEIPFEWTSGHLWLRVFKVFLFARLSGTSEEYIFSRLEQHKEAVERSLQGRADWADVIDKFSSMSMF